MTERERKELSEGYQSAKVFHDHAAEYDNWFAGSSVYAIALLSLDQHYINPQGA
jgi:hypothetical protein